MPGSKPRLHLPYQRWPAEDRRLWERALGDPDDPFSDAAGARLAPASRKAYLMAWRRFLGFLAVEEPASLDVGPAERLTVEGLRRFAAHLAGTNLPQSIAAQVDMLYKAARVVMPERDWAWLKKVKARLYTVPAIRNAKPVITSLQLLELGLELMNENQPPDCGPIRLAQAVRYRDGLMIALLAFMPLRRKNIAALELDRHLIRNGNAWHVVVRGEETKTDSADEFAMPDLLHPYLATYLDVIRPRLLGNSGTCALWVNAKGGPLSYAAIGPVMAKHSVARLGLRIAPHDARDAAATTWAIAAPERITVARDLLAHADLRTTTKHYNRARGMEASRAHARRIAQIRTRR